MLHALVQINALVELAAPLTDKWQPHAIEEAETTAQVGGCLVPREVAKAAAGGRSGGGSRGDSVGGGTTMRGRAAKSSDNCVAAEAGNAGAAPAARRAAMSFALRGIVGRMLAESRTAQ